MQTKFLSSALQPSIAAFVLRFTLGAIFLAHAWFKLFVLKLSHTAEFFTAHGFPSWTAYPTFTFEFIGGTMLLLGLGTRWAALALVPIVIGAFGVHGANGWYFAAPGGGWEYLALLLAALVAQAALGDGAFALRMRESRGAR